MTDSQCVLILPGWQDSEPESFSGVPEQRGKGRPINSDSLLGNWPQGLAWLQGMPMSEGA